MILNQQRRVSNENSENSALLFENRRLDTSIVAILLFSSVSYEQRLLVILSSCNWMHRKHTKTRDRPVWTVWKHLSSWCIVCDCYLSRNIRSSDSFFLSDFLGKSGKLFEKKKPAFGKLRVPESFYILMHWEIKISRYIIRSAMKKICSLAPVIFSDGLFLAIQYRKFYFLHS